MNPSGTHYDLLEIKPDASPQDVRTAYLRTKATYNKDSPALYTLISHDEAEEFLHRIEEAYQVLSHPEKRKEYDRHHGFLSSVETAEVISIDRVPPMESTGSEAELLIPPTTDFTPNLPSPPPFQQNRHAQPTPAPAQSPVPVQDNLLTREILEETQWNGSFLKKIRNARRISIEEMADITKVSKTYLLAVEDENFAKLPAAVFVRGFVMQIARILKLPTEKVVTAYMARFTK